MPDKDLIYSVNKLKHENKELNNKLIKLDKENDKLLKKIEKLENLVASLPPDIIPKDSKAKLGKKKLKFKMATVMFIEMYGFKKISEGQDTQGVIDQMDKI